MLTSVLFDVSKEAMVTGRGPALKKSRMAPVLYANIPRYLPF